MKSTDIESHRQSAQVSTNLDYDDTEYELSQRDAYADLLIEIGDKYPDLVIIDADLSTVGKTFAFAEKWPKRHLQVGIAEQNMMGIAAGMAQFGKIPIVHSLAVFGIGRAFDQIRESICYSELNVKIVGLHAGITLGQDGATHQTMEDIALMTSLPNMSVVAPADADQTRKLLPMIIENNSSTYFRLLFPKIRNITHNLETKLGKLQQIKEGKDLCFFSYGQTLHACLSASDLLEEKGYTCSVINIHTIKPIDREGIIEILKNFEKVIVVEEHNIYGGLGSIIATIASQDCPTKIKFLSTDDKFGLTGLPHEILHHFGLEEKNIFKICLEFLGEN